VHIVSGSTRETVRRIAHPFRKGPTVDLLHDAADWPWSLLTECTTIFRTGLFNGLGFAFAWNHDAFKPNP